MPSTPTEREPTVTHLQEQVSDLLVPYVGEQAGEVAAKITRVVRSESFSGPLPHPKHLAEYDKVQKGFARRILAMTEADLAHRHDCNRRIISAEAGFMVRGQIFAMAALTIMLAATVLFVMTGHELAGALVGGTTLVSVVWAFLGRQNALKEDPSGNKED